MFNKKPELAKYLQQGKELIIRRRLWIILAFVLFMAESYLMIGKPKWAGEEIISFADGRGSRVLESQGENASYHQMFRPQYSKIKSIAIFVVTESQDVKSSNENMHVSISDENGEIISSRAIPYSGVTFGSYMEVLFQLELNPRKSYFLTINFDPLKDGSVPALTVCDNPYGIAENISLSQEGEVENAQILTFFRYIDAIPRGRMLKFLLISFITAILIAMGIPSKKVFRECLGWLVLLAIPYLLGRRLEILLASNHLLLPQAMYWNIGIMYVMELCVLLCSRSMRFTTVFSTFFLTLLYSASHFVELFRGTKLKLGDLTAVKTAAKVAGNFDLRPGNHLAMAWCLAFFFVVIGVQLGSKHKKHEKRLIRFGISAGSFLLGIGLFILMGYLLLNTSLLEKAGFYNLHGFDQQMSYELDGYLVGTCFDIQNSRIRAPKNYSVQQVEEILGRYASDEELNRNTPHVIFIMNESFADLRVLGNLQLSQENLTKFYSLQKNAISGYTSTSVLGGGTANSEFEALTGCSLGLLPYSYYPFQQCMNKPMDSLVSVMKENGYTTYSIHPESKGNWNRNRVYSFLGFDKSYWIEDFDGAEKLHFGVRDRETYQLIEDLYEHRRDGEKLFIFDVTVQNHGGYESDDMAKTIFAENVSCAEADRFLSLIKVSDDDFGELIDYFSHVEEPVILCMFGDHQPKFQDAAFYDSVFEQTEGITEEERKLNLYKTPFVIWANYDIPEKTDVNISVNYLGALLAKTAGIRLSPFFSFVSEQEKESPVMTVNGYRDTEGLLHNWNNEADEFWEYRCLQYYFLFDKKH